MDKSCKILFLVSLIWTGKERCIVKILKTSLYFLIICCYLRYILNSLLLIVFYNIFGKNYLGLFKKLILKIFLTAF